MKMTRKILPALAMLIVSAVMLSTASFAWFAMGSEVVAENMEVSVKSDSTYLVIAKDQAEITDGYSVQSVDFDAAVNKELYPVAFDSTAEGFNSANFTLDTTWYTMQGTSSTDGEGKAGTKTNVSYENLKTDYVLLSTVYIATSTGSEDMANLKAKVTITGDEAVNVLVVTSSAYQNFTATSSDYTASTVLSSTVTGTPIKVDIYVFYNGEHSSITTNNFGLNTILDTVVDVSFTAE